MANLPLAPVLNAYNDIQDAFKTEKIPARTIDPADPSIPPAEILMIIDSGYSHTTVTPLLLGRPIQFAVRRLDIGGKLMTNYLTRLLSVRQYDMRDDTYLVNQIKEKTCFISKDFKADMEKCWKGPKGDRREIYETAGGIAKDYVLPDYHARKEGEVRDHDPNAATKLKELIKGKGLVASEDILTLRSERFTVPELLFSPTDIGLRQSGIAQLVLDSLSALPQGLWPGFLANIVCVGGNTKFPEFIARLQAEMRALAPAECILRMARPDDPIIATWQGGAALARDEVRLAKLSVTKEEYEEWGTQGAAWTARKFGGR